jgi:hypothetical protein
MHLRRSLFCLLAAALAALAAPDEPAKPDAKPEQAALTVIDAAGKEHKLKSWKITQGTRHLAWLAPQEAPDKGDKGPEAKPEGPGDKKAPKGKPNGGPVALELREDNSTTFVNGILTLVPLERLRALEYDNDKKTVTAKVATGPKADETAVLTGSTKYQGINKITIEAEVDKGDMGVAEIKFLGGQPKGVKELRFGGARAEATPPARPAKITIADGKKTVLEASDVQALYRAADGTERLSPFVMFKKTLKVDLNKVKKASLVMEGDEKSVTVVFTDGEEQTLTPLPMITLDGKEMEFLGLLGRVPAGYKHFPLHTFVEVEFGAAPK